jgi:hypothetical protein
METFLKIAELLDVSLNELVRMEWHFELVGNYNTLSG